MRREEGIRREDGIKTYFIDKAVQHFEISLPRRGSPQCARRPVVEPAQGGVVLLP
jgi:hypothetical protein